MLTLLRIPGWAATVAVLLASALRGQTPRRITLAEARQLAISNQPRIAASLLTARAAAQAIKESRAALFPTLSANVTGVEAEAGSAVAAGAITTSSLSSRAATGVVLSQLITDFGRTSRLTESAQLRARAQDQGAVNTRASVLLNVSESYFETLAAEAVQQVAQAALDQRRLLLRQVTALASSALKSTLDVSFAQVTVSQAEMTLTQAQNNVSAAQARLSAGLGYDHPETFQLAEEAMPPALPPDAMPLRDAALQARPDLAALRLSRDASHRLAEAEKRLKYPTVSALGVAGEVPAHDPGLHGSYGAAGVNVNIPVLNGGLYSAREAEAELRAEAADRDVQELTLEVSRDVEVAWLAAKNAFQLLDVANRLAQQANEALRLAQARYDAGLGSIVELTQAQYSQTSAQIGSATARYQYLAARSALDYASGALR